MCTLPPFPTLPTSSIDPCSLVSKGALSCPITYPSIVGLPVWGVQVVLWVMVYIPLTWLGCFLNSTASLIETALYGFVTTLQNALVSMFTFLASLFAWAGPWAPILGALVVALWLIIVVVVALVLVDVGEEAAKVAVEAA